MYRRHFARPLAKQAGMTVPTQYSLDLKAFSLRPQFYSFRFCNYVRPVFDKSFPHPRTMAKRYDGTDGAPVFSKEEPAALEIKEHDDCKADYATL